MLWMAAPAHLAAAYPNVTYTATGTFASPPVSGLDTFRLAGEPFTISIVANDSQLTKFHGPSYADYGPLRMTGSINTQLIPTPVAIASNASFILMAYGNPSYDLFEIGSQLTVISVSLHITAVIVLPKGTLTTVRNHPFGPVTLTPSMATMTYTDGISSTTLALSGTLTGVATAIKTTASIVPFRAQGDQWARGIPADAIAGDEMRRWGRPVNRV
jgi:hypothetical protein